jgi:hypothetical protein
MYNSRSFMPLDKTTPQIGVLVGYGCGSEVLSPTYYWIPFIRSLASHFTDCDITTPAGLVTQLQKFGFYFGPVNTQLIVSSNHSEEYFLQKYDPV